MKTQVGEGHAFCLLPRGEIGKTSYMDDTDNVPGKKREKASNLFDIFEGIKSRKFVVEIEQKNAGRKRRTVEVGADLSCEEESTK